jgi:uncharacterized membrane-anchored protein YhcB (DUF1043 family)
MSKTADNIKMMWFITVMWFLAGLLVGMIIGAQLERNLVVAPLKESVRLSKELNDKHQQHIDLLELKIELLEKVVRE